MENGHEVYLSRAVKQGQKRSFVLAVSILSLNSSHPPICYLLFFGLRLKLPEK